MAPTPEAASTRSGWSEGPTACAVWSTRVSEFASTKAVATVRPPADSVHVAVCGSRRCEKGPSAQGMLAWSSATFISSPDSAQAEEAAMRATSALLLLS